MTTPKSLDRYGDEFIDLAQAIAQLSDARPELRLTMPSRGKAINLRQKFYAWRKLALAEAQHLVPLAAASCAVTVHNDGTIVFTRGEPALSDLRQQLQQQGFDLSAARGGPQGTPQQDVPQVQPQPQMQASPQSAAREAQQRFEDQLRALGFTGAHDKKEQ